METGLVPQSVRSARQTGLQWEQQSKRDLLATTGEHALTTCPVRDWSRILVRFRYVQRAGELFRLCFGGRNTVTNKTPARILCKSAVRRAQALVNCQEVYVVSIESCSQSILTESHYKRNHLTRYPLLSWIPNKLQFGKMPPSEFALRHYLRCGHPSDKCPQKGRLFVQNFWQLMCFKEGVIL